MRRTLNILFAAFEAVPFLKTGGLGDVAGSLPAALRGDGCEVRVMLPKFDAIPPEYRARMTHLADFRVRLGWRDLYCGIETLEEGGVTCYFIDNEYYFKRGGPYGYFDDGERIAFFSKAVVESLQYLPDFRCDVLHCNDWHTALAPVFLREFYQGLPLYENVKTVLTVHNLKFQGQMSDSVLGDILGLAHIPAAARQLRSDSGSVNFLKGGLCYSDLLTTVSPTYAEEIKSAFYGERLDEVFRRRADVLSGIRNGIDTARYDPASDPQLAARFSRDELSGKAVCKAALQRELGLPEEERMPLVILVGRLTEQKGLDLLQRVLDELLAQPVQLAVLGTGERRYEDMLRYFAWKYGEKMRALLTFDEPLSRRMYAGADLLLMPSLFEPCGLAQMIAMRYGTLPVVRETGGLRDSVQPYNRFTGEGTGFSFANYNAHEMKDALCRALLLYREEPERFRALVRNAMEVDFSWDRAAREYRALYRRLHPEVEPCETAEALREDTVSRSETEGPAAPGRGGESVPPGGERRASAADASGTNPMSAAGPGRAENSPSEPERAASEAGGRTKRRRESAPAGTGAAQPSGKARGEPAPPDVPGSERAPSTEERAPSAAKAASEPRGTGAAPSDPEGSALEETPSHAENAPSSKRRTAGRPRKRTPSTEEKGSPPPLSEDRAQTARKTKKEE